MGFVIVIPLLIALITGLLAGLLAVTLTAWAKYYLDLPWLNPWAVFSVIMTALWLRVWLRVGARLLKVLEKYLGVDIDGDGFVGPAREGQRAGGLLQGAGHWSPPVHIEITSNNGNSTDYVDVPYRDALKDLAPGLLAGTRTFSLDACAIPSKGFGRKEFGELRTYMINGQLAKWRNPRSVNQGVELTELGRAVLTEITKQPGTLQLFRPPAAKYEINDRKD